MRKISAALLGASAAWPALVHATTAFADPADAAASVPAIVAPSALDDYRRYRDDDGPNWPQLNREVAPRPRKAAAAPAGADGGAAAGAHGHGAMHGGAE
ncbi:Uncharacterised protein [Burkholderia pseudomallei]|uniref:Exported protein n=8 Tax=Burkholderia pseudomallei TaxID=28450 RepID=Q63N43_BURPS|nr:MULTISPECIES: hypothetical protein [Burkholderia]EIF60521.1 hypothetical protein BP1258A_3272 [Burkholderia pseudomallei 1258a]KGW46331.1 hypothetical protein Y049_4909 [Burkholderia pseudomallei MSHR684]KGX78741.1 hypothetical protein Y033_5065 [Burkholderia pseudomallei MSHR435]ABN95715.1 hypothetical protein BURPS1106A_A0620 [Burkholderia pseudomallei 1106a]AFI68774.1 hypothetical protein BP1026B_II0508 [Burkholderia pseudomallei 1026b]